MEHLQAYLSRSRREGVIMGQLQSLLQRSQSQNMGLQPMLDKRQREAEQAGNATVRDAQSKAQGITGVANAQAAGIVGQANAGNPWVKAYEGYDARKTTMDTAKAKAEKEAKEAKAKVDSAKLKADNAMKLEKVKEKNKADKVKKNDEKKKDDDYTSTKNLMKRWKQVVNIDNYEESVTKMNARADSLSAQKRYSEASILLDAIEDVTKLYRIN